MGGHRRIQRRQIVIGFFLPIVASNRIEVDPGLAVADGFAVAVAVAVVVAVGFLRTPSVILRNGTKEPFSAGES